MTMGGMGPIPFSAINAYAERYGIRSMDAFDRFLTLIRRQDSEFLRLQANKGRGQEGTQIDPADATGVKALLDRLKASRSNTEPDESSPSSLSDQGSSPEQPG